MQSQLAPCPSESAVLNENQAQLVVFPMPDEYLGEPSGWRIVREKFPEKHQNYTITNDMHSYLLSLGNEKLYNDVMVNPTRLMVRTSRGTAKGTYLYPSMPGTNHGGYKPRPKNGKAISKILKRMLDMPVTAKNPFTKRNETLSYDEHAAIAILAGAIKDRNFRHLNMLLERTEGKVAEEINGNLTMGLASALKLINKEDDESSDDSEDHGELIEHEADDPDSD